MATVQPIGARLRASHIPPARGWSRANNIKKLVMKSQKRILQQALLGEVASSRRRFMTRHSESQSKALMPNVLLSPRKTIRIGNWNVRTMYEAGRSSIDS